jgi:hypothetical protein
LTAYLGDMKMPVWTRLTRAGLVVLVIVVAVWLAILVKREPPRKADVRLVAIGDVDAFDRNAHAIVESALSNRGITVIWEGSIRHAFYVERNKAIIAKSILRMDERLKANKIHLY